MKRHGIAVVLGLMLAGVVLPLAATLYRIWADNRIAGPSPAVQAPAPSQAPSPPAAPARKATAPPAPRSGFVAPATPWEASLRQADIDRGKQLALTGQASRGVQACSACHGQAANPAGQFPDLAGQPARYLAKQLFDFRSGSRQQALMNSVAQALDEADIAALAAYYGSLPGPASRPSPADLGPAYRLDREGDGPRALPACANCHGAAGRGEGESLPRLAGQPEAYFVAQMQALRSGARANDEDGVMRAFAQRLTDEEIRALARYYAPR